MELCKHAGDRVVEPGMQPDKDQRDTSQAGTQAHSHTHTLWNSEPHLCIPDKQLRVETEPLVDIWGWQDGSSDPPKTEAKSNTLYFGGS